MIFIYSECKYGKIIRQAMLPAFAVLFVMLKPQPTCKELNNMNVKSEGDRESWSRFLVSLGIWLFVQM